jgi:hypothetical protein
MAISFEDGLAYEAARELINSRIGTLSSRLDEESRKDTPDLTVLGALRSERRSLVVEREELRSDDQEGVMQVIAKYRRPPASAPMPTLAPGA